ncbi:MAG TPA: adenine phosphoribosyltransferase [bacterium]|nr:adenine phosphoribosyltransferase [Dictyoglomota bacterium]HHV80850.1 adenine phosphoribosyltransferase [bacterium]HOK29480.1 adenine phosphoribosyltransferase [bacterium]HOL54733.1 adenine phosphoribosyltransferase [bacterium]HON71756.1 adenine phosphoribosyltransferase [bacterium]
MEVDELVRYIRSIPDFPVKGVLFRDITPLLKDRDAFKTAVSGLADNFRDCNVDLVSAVEARGFIIGAPLAIELSAGFVPIRKPGKLPYDSIREEYSLEYGTNVLEMHRDAIKPGEKVLIADDLIATGGTAIACKNLIERSGGIVVGFVFLVELTEFNAREQLKGYDVYSLLKF